MSLITKVVFPVPPPTTNDLSSHQRTHLLRKAKKLEQIFGVTPRLLDNTLEPSNPFHIAFPGRPSQHRRNKTVRGSIDSSSSTSSSESKVPSCNLPSIRVINSYHSQGSSVSSIDSCDTGSGKAKVPVRRLIMRSPTLETIPASPSPSNTSYSKSSRQSPIDRNSDILLTQFTPIPDEDFSLSNSTTPYSYNITSFNSLRKQKMDRLRKKLGQDVPFDLVFPSSDTESIRSITPNLPVDIVKESGVLLSPPVPRPRKNSKRISNARDSISESTLVHRAKRQTITPTTPTKSDSSSSESNQFTRLSLIIESPDEHGVGCAQEFGRSFKAEQSTKFKSEWTVSTGGTEVKLWSTRGYEGWCPEAPPNASQTSGTISSPIPSPRPSVPSSNIQLKKKPPSYRKPVPPSFLYF